MFCSNCGDQIISEDNFCKSCGTATQIDRVNQNIKNNSNFRKYLPFMIGGIFVLSIIASVINGVCRNENGSDFNKDGKNNDSNNTGISRYPEVDQDVLLYLKENYPSYEFDLYPDYSMGPPILSYTTTEKSGEYISGMLTYNMESGEIIADSIPDTLISNEFEDFVSERIGEIFLNSKVYMKRNEWIGGNHWFGFEWRSWDEYEFTLENYIKYLEKNDGGYYRIFFIVVDSKDYGNRLSQIEKFQSDIDKHLCTGFRLIYVPTEQFNQADEYFNGGGFELGTPFLNSGISDEFIWYHQLKNFN